MYKFIGADGKEYGPITADQLRQWIAEGRANSQTKILPEGTTEWRPLSDFPEFMPAIAGTAPPPVPGLVAAPGVAQAQVSGPATGLIVVAILSLLCELAALIWHLAGRSAMPGGQLPNQAWANLLSGPFVLASNALGILLSVLVLLGGIKMKNLESYGLAMTASIVAMLPCSCSCLIGLPVGIWALVILSKPEVKNAFH